MSSGKQRWILSGGIASGKSKVREFFAQAGVTTIDADRIGHEVLEPDGPAFAAVAERWPGAVADGRIDRAALASVVFNDPEELGELEAITHPHIFDTIRARVEGLEGTIVVEMPLVAERLGDQWRRIVVDARDEVRLQRAVDRGMVEEDARSRMASQPSRSEWLAAADLVVPNHGTIEELEEEVSGLAELL